LPNQGSGSPSFGIEGFTAREINGVVVMEDTLRKLFHHLKRAPEQKNTRHLLTGNSSAGADLLYGSASRPHITLKARMLGGQAKTIMRLGGSTR